MKCIDCKHWDDSPHTVNKGDDWKICGLLDEWDDNGKECSKTLLADLENGDDASSGAYLHTNKDFGCVEFKGCKKCPECGGNMTLEDPLSGEDKCNSCGYVHSELRA